MSIATFTVGERVSAHDGARRRWGVIVQILASRLLVIQFDDGHRVRKHSA